MTRPAVARPTPRALLLAAAVVVIGLLSVFTVDRCSSAGSGTGGPGSAALASVTGTATPRSGLPTIAVADLPAQARDVIALIDRGGPFPYRQDGTVFNNFEGHLPHRSTGYYHEYTVVTPGSDDRGERRLIAGRDGDLYYTDDHYETFRQVIR